MIHPLPPIQKKEVREVERCTQKLAKSGCSLLFNKAYLNENVPLPTTQILVVRYFRCALSGSYLTYDYHNEYKKF